jgi:hypothetical protein
MLNRLRMMWLRWGLILTSAAVVTACGSKPVQKLPPAPPQVIEAAVAIPVACEIEQVPTPSYPAQQARKGDDIFTLSKIIAADRKVRQGETVELRAANTGGCE